jgi:hypothetical protein
LKLFPHKDGRKNRYSWGRDLWSNGGNPVG